MKTTLTLYLLNRRKTADGLYPVYFRITQSRSYSLYSTGIYIEKKHWNKKGNYTKRNWIKDHPSADAWNHKIYQIWKDIEKIIDENEDIHRKEIVKKLNESDESSSITVHEYALQFSEALKEDGKFNPFKQTKTSANKFKDYTDYLKPGDEVTFEDVTSQMLNDFQTWLSKDKKQDDGSIEKGNHPNTIASNMVKLKAVFREAHKVGLMKENPFDHPNYEQKREVETKKKALSIEQILDIEALELEERSRHWHVRNYFMFSFYCAGIRFSDFAHLKWENIKDGRLIYKMSKSVRDGVKIKEKNIKLLDEANEILDYYRDDQLKKTDFIFPLLPDNDKTLRKFDEMKIPPELSKELLIKAYNNKKANSKNVIVNRKLKDLQKMAGIDTNISFHISRHSFSRWAKAEGLSIDAIGKALAHSKRSTTEQYLNSLSEYDADEELKSLVNSKGKK